MRPPRSVFVNFPLGHQTGKPFDPALQTSIVKDALNALVTMREPGSLVELPYRWAPDDSWEQAVVDEALQRKH